MRILFVSHTPLDPELGGSQIPLRLAAALAERGHEAQAWSPEPLPAGTRWWQRWRAQQRAIEAKLASEPPFDVVDLPAVSLTPRIAAAAVTVARSLQPDFAYMAADLRAELRRRPLPPLGLPLRALHALRIRRVILAGWRRADRILCLGSLELSRMRARYPAWLDKLAHYAVAPSAEERAALAAVRRGRQPATALRALWIGRWAAHKGPERLVALLHAWLPRNPGLRVTIAGCGESARAALPAESLESGRVEIVPRFRRDELPALLAAHNVGLFTSSSEGWGLSLNEMLEAGLTVYATEAGGVPDLRPYFPHQLQPFPPPTDLRPEDLAQPSVSASYEGDFRWPRIAATWEEGLAPLVAARGRR